MNKIKTYLLSVFSGLLSLNSYSQNPIIDSVVTNTFPPDTLQVKVYGQLPYTGCTGPMFVITNISFLTYQIDIEINVFCNDTGNWVYIPFTYTDFIDGLFPGNYSLCCHLCANIISQIYCDSTCKTVIMSTDNIYDKTEYFFIYPNPTSGLFTLSIKEKTPGEIFIYNSLGQLIYQSSIINNQSAIDLSSRPRGIYFVKVITRGKGQGTGDEEKIYIEKIIIQ